MVNLTHRHSPYLLYLLVKNKLLQDALVYKQSQTLAKWVHKYLYFVALIELINYLYESGRNETLIEETPQNRPPALFCTFQNQLSSVSSPTGWEDHTQLDEPTGYTAIMKPSSHSLPEKTYIQKA